MSIFQCSFHIFLSFTSFACFLCIFPFLFSFYSTCTSSYISLFLYLPLSSFSTFLCFHSYFSRTSFNRFPLLAFSPNIFLLIISSSTFSSSALRFFYPSLPSSIYIPLPLTVFPILPTFASSPFHITPSLFPLSPSSIPILFFTSSFSSLFHF